MEEEPELSPAAAAKKAMAQLTAPIRSSSRSGSSPGSPECCSSKIAVTIIAAVLISAFNALTLSPTLCAVFLRHPGPRRGLMGLISLGIDGVRGGRLKERSRPERSLAFMLWSSASVSASRCSGWCSSLHSGSASAAWCA